jgi:hypothetical protein
VPVARRAIAGEAGGVPSTTPVPFLQFSFTDDGMGIEQAEVDEMFRDHAGVGVARAVPARERAAKLHGAKVAPEADAVPADAGDEALDEEEGGAATGALVLCRAAAQVLGGSVGVRSEPGAGSMLFAKVPAFASPEALLQSVFGGRATESLRRLAVSIRAPGAAAAAPSSGAVEVVAGHGAPAPAASGAMLSTVAEQNASMLRAYAGAMASKKSFASVLSTNSEVAEERFRAAKAATKLVLDSMTQEERALIEHLVVDLHRTNIR